MTTTMKYLLIVLAIVLLIVVFVLMNHRIERNLDQLSNLPITEINFDQIQDGTYVGTYAVFPIRVKLSAQIEQGRLTTLSLQEHRNGQGQKAEELLEHVLAAQSLQVDTVSGATYSSMVILKAIESAFQEQHTP
ncbi:MAG: FMN-binding protein [Sphaerochaetaceae bacterium]